MYNVVHIRIIILTVSSVQTIHWPISVPNFVLTHNDNRSKQQYVVCDLSYYTYLHWQVQKIHLIWLGFDREGIGLICVICR